MTRINRLLAAVLGLLLSMQLLVPAMAVQTGAEPMAEDISGTELITDHKGFPGAHSLFDKNTIVSKRAEPHSYMTLSYPEGIGSLYLIFDLECGSYTVTNNDTGSSCIFGETGFLHEFIDLEAAFGDTPTSVTLTFGENPVLFNELYVFTPGQVPDFVQKWEQPRENETDLILFSTHGDDEQLFFAGVLPYYAAELDYEVLVVYLTCHRNFTRERAHEMLNGLWAVGVTTYPILGGFPDFHIKSKEGAYSMFQGFGYSQEDITAYVVENLRRFKPKVAIGHDPLGEYSHGQHMVYSEVLQNAVQSSMDPDYFPESARKYGVWDVPKTYLHLYEENPIVMDWDQPLEAFGGMSAFLVTKELGFTCHESQYWDFAWYMSGCELATQVPKYSPCEYGLFRSTVGEDAEKNDFFENVLTYDQEKQQAREEAERREAQELADREAEEQARKEEAERLAGEQAMAEQTEPAGEPEAEKNPQRTMILICAAVAAAAAAALAVLIFLLVKKR